MPIVASNPTDHFLGACSACARPIRETREQTDRHVTTGCPECGRDVVLERLFATQSQEPCDPRCMGATGPSCSCACGGANHAGAFSVEHGEMLQSALEAYRDRLAKADAVRAARIDRERRARDEIFADWAAEHADVLGYLANSGSWSDFFDSLQQQVDEHRPLTERQVAAVRNAIARDRERAERDAHAKAAATTAAPAGTTCIEGEIITVRQLDNDYNGGVVHKLRVLADGGYQVYLTMPRAIAPREYSALDWQAFLKSLPGKRIRFTAELSPSAEDPAFAYGKRPRSAALL